MSILGTNLSAIQAANYYTQNNTALTNSISALASGSALSNPASDPAGVAVSGNLSAQVNDLSAANQGLQDLSSLGQTVDGYLSTIQQGVSQLGSLAIQASNGTLNPQDSQNYATVFNSLKSALTNITNNASFDGNPIFSNGSVTTSANSSGTQTSLTLSTTGTPASLGINTLDISTQAGAQAAVQTLSSAISTIGSRRAQVSAETSALNFYTTNNQTESLNVQSANSKISDLNVAQEATANATHSILSQASLSVLAHANAIQANVSKLLLG